MVLSFSSPKPTKGLDALIVVVDEDKVYEAMGFKAADERAEEAAREAIPIPTMIAEMQ